MHDAFTILFGHISRVFRLALYMYFYSGSVQKSGSSARCVGATFVFPKACERVFFLSNMAGQWFVSSMAEQVMLPRLLVPKPWARCLPFFYPFFFGDFGPWRLTMCDGSISGFVNESSQTCIWR